MDYPYTQNLHCQIFKQNNKYILINKQSHNTPGILFPLKFKNVYMQVSCTISSTTLDKITFWIGDNNKQTIQKIPVKLNGNTKFKHSFFCPPNTSIGFLFPSDTNKKQFILSNLLIQRHTVMHRTQQMSTRKVIKAVPIVDSDIPADKEKISDTIDVEKSTDTSYSLQNTDKVSLISREDLEPPTKAINKQPTNNNISSSINSKITTSAPKNAKKEIKPVRAQIRNIPEIDLGLRKFNHFIITRFALDIYNNDNVFKEDYLAIRYSLLKSICLPSVLSQINKNFIWIVITDVGLPPKYKSMLYADIPSPHRVIEYDHTRQFGSWLNNTIETLYDPTRALITTRLDDDDALAYNFTLFLQNDIKNQTLNNSMPFKFISYPNGIIGHFKNGLQIYPFYNPWIAIGLSMVSSVPLTIYNFNHRKIKDTLQQMKKNDKFLFISNKAMEIFRELDLTNLQTNKMMLLFRPSEQVIFQGIHSHHMSENRDIRESIPIPFPRKLFKFNPYDISVSHLETVINVKPTQTSNVNNKKQSDDKVNTIEDDNSSSSADEIIHHPNEELDNNSLEIVR